MTCGASLSSKDSSKPNVRTAEKAAKKINIDVSGGVILRCGKMWKCRSLVAHCARGQASLIRHNLLVLLVEEFVLLDHLVLLPAHLVKFFL